MSNNTVGAQIGYFRAPCLKDRDASPNGSEFEYEVKIGEGGLLSCGEPRTRLTSL